MSLTDPVRFSNLRAYGRSAAHGLLSRTTETKPTAAMQRGTGVHAMLFGTKVVLPYEGTRRGKEWEAFKAAHGDVEILPASDYAKAQGMVNALQRSKVAAPLLEGIYEDTILFNWYGMDCRVTPDVRGNGFVTDLKTCQSAHPERFPWHSLRMAYHGQMRYQQMGTHLPEAYIVAVEYTEPYVVQCFRVTDEALMAADKLLSAWMEKLKIAESSQAWGGYSEMVLPLDVPNDDADQLVFPEDE